MKQLLIVGLLGVILTGCALPKGEKCHTEGHDHNEHEVCVKTK
jgi:hypothetical protein